jgi:hypothetical protein
MSNGNSHTQGLQNRTPVLQNEDWWACFIGWFILLLAILGVHEVETGKWAISILPHTPKIGTWTTDLSAAFPKGMATLTTTLILFAFTAVSTLIAGYFLKFDTKRYIPGYLLIFLLTFISMIISKQAFIKE